ncbi:MAG: hypothetical protein VW804_12715, partial [Verrucomicrobiota bacterium]
MKRLFTHFRRRVLLQLPTRVWVGAAVLCLSHLPATGSTEAMAQRLAYLAKRSNPVRNTYLNTLRARMQAAAIASAASDEQRLDPMIQQAVEWLNAGASEEA